MNNNTQDAVYTQNTYCILFGVISVRMELVHVAVEKLYNTTLVYKQLLHKFLYRHKSLRNYIELHSTIAS